MIGRFFISKEFFYRKRFENKFIINLVKKIICNDSYLPMNILNLNSGKKHTISRSHTRCRFSGRSKANFNKFKMSRMIFKKNAENNNLNGVKKSSW